jgi:ACT domain-containing protein
LGWEVKMKKAYDYFEEFVKEEKRFPTLEEFKQLGYSRATYYRCKNDYKPTEPEEDTLTFEKY